MLDVYLVLKITTVLMGKHASIPTFVHVAKMLIAQALSHARMENARKSLAVSPAETMRNVSLAKMKQYANVKVATNPIQMQQQNVLTVLKISTAPMVKPAITTYAHVAKILIVLVMKPATMEHVRLLQQLLPPQQRLLTQRLQPQMKMVKVSTARTLAANHTMAGWECV